MMFLLFYAPFIGHADTSPRQAARVPRALRLAADARCIAAASFEARKGVAAVDARRWRAGH